MVYCCSVANIELCADFRQCLLTVSADIARTIWAIQHVLDYVIYGWGSAFDVTHEVTINVIVLHEDMAFIARVLMYSRGNTTECFAYF